MKDLITSLFLLISIAVQAQTVTPGSYTVTEGADSTFYVLTLKDGTVLTGRMLGKDEQTVRFEDVSLGKLTLEPQGIRSTEAAGEKKFILQLKDGKKYTATIIKRTAAETTFSTTSLGSIIIANDRIESIKALGKNEEVNSKGWFANPNATRYLFGPSAIPLKKGEGYYQNAYFAVNSVNVGVTDNISIGGGLMGFILPFATIKASGKVARNVYAGGGMLYSMLPGFGNGRVTHAGILFGVGTVGTVEHNFTGGLGYGFFNSEMTDGPIVTLNGMTRIGKRVSLVSENWLVPVSAPSYYGVYSYAVRIMGEKHSFDLGFLNNRDFFQFLPLGIPYVDYVLKF